MPRSISNLLMKIRNIQVFDGRWGPYIKKGRIDSKFKRKEAETVNLCETMNHRKSA